MQEKSHEATLYFWDGIRKIDMVLAFVDVEKDDDNKEEYERILEKRKTFVRNLEKQGLELELEPSKVSTVANKTFHTGA